MTALCPEIRVAAHGRDRALNGGILADAPGAGPPQLILISAAGLHRAAGYVAWLAVGSVVVGPSAVGDWGVRLWEFGLFGAGCKGGGDVVPGGAVVADFEDVLGEHAFGFADGALRQALPTEQEAEVRLSIASLFSLPGRAGRVVPPGPRPARAAAGPACAAAHLIYNLVVAVRPDQAEQQSGRPGRPSRPPAITPNDAGRDGSLTSNRLGALRKACTALSGSSVQGRRFMLWDDNDELAMDFLDLVTDAFSELRREPAAVVLSTAFGML